ncbi:hypothetical protein AVEN_258045-1 [Araneus ventricosus]|uniref:Uncharacterized protein n=1 Tax=Araneus ventricosus TaxID=182803 RepID=A0A4Y2V0E2_ARAVE|nr:hypothetical protein AVEN_258045-1 [Araneus ventricosus]
MQRLTILNTQVHLCDAFRGPQGNSAPRAISKLNSLIPRRIFGGSDMNWTLPARVVIYPTTSPPAHSPSLKAHGNGLWLARIIGIPRLSSKRSQNATSHQKKKTVSYRPSSLSRGNF